MHCCIRRCLQRYIHTYIRTYVHTYACMHTYMHAYAETDTYTHTYIHMLACRHTCMHTQRQIHTCMHACLSTQTRTLNSFASAPCFKNKSTESTAHYIRAYMQAYARHIQSYMHSFKHACTHTYIDVPCGLVPQEKAPQVSVAYGQNAAFLQPFKMAFKLDCSVSRWEPPPVADISVTQQQLVAAQPPLVRRCLRSVVCVPRNSSQKNTFPKATPENQRRR